MKKVIFSIIILLSQVHFPVQSNSWIKDSCHRITDFFNISRDFCAMGNKHVDKKDDKFGDFSDLDKALKDLKKITHELSTDILDAHIKNLKKYCVKSGPSLNHNNEKKCRDAIKALKSLEEILKKDQTEYFSDILNKIDNAREKYIKEHNKNFPIHKRI